MYGVPQASLTVPAVAGPLLNEGLGIADEQQISAVIHRAQDPDVAHGRQALECDRQWDGR
jgi:hypothetical protein